MGWGKIARARPGELASKNKLSATTRANGSVRYGDHFEPQTVTHGKGALFVGMECLASKRSPFNSERMHLGSISSKLGYVTPQTRNAGLSSHINYGTAGWKCINYKLDAGFIRESLEMGYNDSSWGWIIEVVSA